jgi:hypothetical protein
MSTVPIGRHVFGIVLFVSLWLIGLLFFCLHILIVDYPIDYPTTRLDPFTPAILYGFPRITAEVVALYFILRPNSFRWSWHRVLIAFALFILWSLYSIAQGTMHAPGWVFAHFWWMLGLLGGLLVVLVVSALGALLRRRRMAAT